MSSSPVLQSPLRFLLLFHAEFCLLSFAYEMRFSCYVFFSCYIAPVMLYTAHIGGFLLSVQNFPYLIIPGTKISPQLTGTRLYTPISYGLMVMSGYLILDFKSKNYLCTLTLLYKPLFVPHFVFYRTPFVPHFFNKRRKFAIIYDSLRR